MVGEKSERNGALTLWPTAGPAGGLRAGRQKMRTFDGANRPTPPPLADSLRPVRRLARTPSPLLAQTYSPVLQRFPIIEEPGGDAPRPDDLVDQIFEGLRQKASAKQAIWRHAQETFAELREVSQEIVDELARRLTPVDENVIIELRAISEFEFQIRFSGDLLVFVLHSNIVTFGDEYPLLQSEYVADDFRRRFFGHIMAYNFMADALRYARMQDTGYLMGRLLVNIEQKLFLEGAQELNMPAEQRAAVQPLDHNRDTLRTFVESAMIAAVNNDLLAPDLDSIRQLTVKQKLENQQLNAPPRKVGFTFGLGGGVVR